MAVKLIKAPKGSWHVTDGYVLDCSALEAGDKTALHNNSRMGGGHVAVYTVVRRTKTQIITTDGRGQEIRFRAEDGSPVGESHYTCLRAVFDPIVLDAMEEMRMRDYRRHLEELMKGKTSCHDSRFLKLADVIEDTTKAQKDIVEIRTAQHEWIAAKELADAQS